MLPTFLLAAHAAQAVSCAVNPAQRFPEAHLPDADAAMAKGKVEDAVALYKKALAANATDPGLNAALAEAELDEEKVADAGAVIAQALRANPKSAVLETVQAEVQLSAGRPWDAQDTITRALADDPCYPDAHLVEGRLLTFQSMRGSAAKQFAIAYQLAPHDNDAFSRYLDTLPVPRRIDVVNRLIAGGHLDDDAQKQLERTVTRLKNAMNANAGACTLVNASVTAAEIPLLPLMDNGQKVRAAGLDVSIQGKPIHLEIDTGAGGLVLSAAAAARADLQYSADTEFTGVGSEKAQKAHVAFAKSIKIGTLEFRDCPVAVYDRQRLTTRSGSVIDNTDGLIGLDTLQRFLITLDYPHGKLRLAPLPTRPQMPAEMLSLESGAEQPQVSDTSSAVGNSSWQDRYVAPELKDYALVYRVGRDLIVPASIAEGTSGGKTGDKTGGKIGLFLLDTGAYRTMVTTDAAKELGKIHRDQEDEVYGLGGEVKDLYYLDQVTFNFARVSVITNQVPVVVAGSMGMVHRDMQLWGLLGASALRQCTVHIDYRDGLIKLDYTPGPTRF